MERVGRGLQSFLFNSLSTNSKSFRTLNSTYIPGWGFRLELQLMDKKAILWLALVIIYISR